MNFFKNTKKRIDFGNYKRVLEITIPRYDIEYKFSHLPLMIGCSANNHIVIQDNDVDKFQVAILQNKNLLFLVNLSQNQELILGNRRLRFLETFDLKESVQVRINEIQLMIMPNISVKGREVLRDKLIQCPFCGEWFKISEGCPVCEFGRKKDKRGSIEAKFSKIAERKEEMIEPTTMKLKLGGVEELKAVFVVESGDFKGKIIEVPSSNSEITIGRSIYNTVSLSFLEDQTISRFHCKIRIEGNKSFISDNNSLNGTYLNEKLIKQESPIESGDTIRLGKSVIRFKLYKEGAHG